MNENKKRTPARFNFNLLDVIIILLALFCIVGVWQRKNLQNLFRSGNAYDAYTVSFTAEGVRGNTAALLEEGVGVYVLDEKGTKISFGSLTDTVTRTPATARVLRGEESVTVTYPEDERSISDLSGKLACRMVEKNGRFLLDGKYQLAVNQTVTVHTETADLVIRITNIEKSS